MSSNPSNDTSNSSNANKSQNDSQATNGRNSVHTNGNNTSRDARPVSVYPHQLEEGPTETPNAHVGALRDGIEDENAESTAK